MSRRYVILCGVPEHDCTGGRYITDQQLPRKAHASRSDAFKCYKRYLTHVKGYRQRKGHSARDMYKEGEPILVLSKQSHFGTRLRAGKEGTRLMPEHGRGVILSS